MGAIEAYGELVAMMRGGELVIVSFLDEVGDGAHSVGRITHLDSRMVAVHAGGRCNEQRIRLACVTLVEKTRRPEGGAP